jgi:hypothetical protein
MHFIYMFYMMLSTNSDCIPKGTKSTNFLVNKQYETTDILIPVPMKTRVATEKQCTQF